MPKDMQNRITFPLLQNRKVLYGLMNKNLDSLETELKERAQEGLSLARAVDAQTRILKKGNYIRKNMGLHMK